MNFPATKEAATSEAARLRVVGSVPTGPLQNLGAVPAVEGSGLELPLLSPYGISAAASNGQTQAQTTTTQAHAIPQVLPAAGSMAGLNAVFLRVWIGQSLHAVAPPLSPQELNAARERYMGPSGGTAATRFDAVRITTGNTQRLARGRSCAFR